MGQARASFWRRTRMVSFRVSDREYEQLRTQSEAEGARSVSDFARVALCGSRHTAGVAAAPETDLDDLRGELQALNERVRRVSELLERTPRQAARQAPDAAPPQERRRVAHA